MGNYIVVPFTCLNCNKRMEAHLAATLGPGIAGHKAICPKCGVEHYPEPAGFPDRVIEVIEVEES